jgi:hypothetical protein
MSAERKGLDLSDFEEGPVEKPAAAPDPHAMRARLERRAIDEVAEFRRRDPGDELTITVRGPSKTIKAFKQLCARERRSQAVMLQRLLDAYGEAKPGED